MLTQEPNNNKFVYLQELINNNFVDQIKRNFSVDGSITNEIRNYSFICGWKNGGNITDLYNVADYLKFLMKGIGFGGINIELLEHDEKDLQEPCFKDIDITKTLEFQVIELNVTEDSNIKNLLDKWIDKNIKKNKTSLISFKLMELPMIIPIRINRTNENSNNLTFCVDIMEKIRFKNHTNKNQNKTSWIIHSVICFSNSGGGNYYSIVQGNDNQWYLFSNDKMPSFFKINILEKDISEKIKQECVLILYRLNDDICKF
jgi:hypothetical protein